jgi:hypothetical protein
MKLFAEAGLEARIVQLPVVAASSRGTRAA